MKITITIREFKFELEDNPQYVNYNIKDFEKIISSVVKEYNLIENK